MAPRLPAERLCRKAAQSRRSALTAAHGTLPLLLHQAAALRDRAHLCAPCYFWLSSVYAHTPLLCTPHPLLVAPSQHALRKHAHTHTHTHTHTHLAHQTHFRIQFIHTARGWGFQSFLKRVGWVQLAFCCAPGRLSTPRPAALVSHSRRLFLLRIRSRKSRRLQKGDSICRDCQTFALTLTNRVCARTNSTHSH
jgi:hypothetical protein